MNSMKRMLHKVNFVSIISECKYSTKPDKAYIRQRRATMFDEELKRQKALITDIEKITVSYEGFPKSASLIMNKGLSTPADCGKHISDIIERMMPLASVDGLPWEMHRPLEEDCKLMFNHFKEEDPFYPNQAFWNSCTLMLGSVIENVFMDNIPVNLCDSPFSNVADGHFFYDAEIDYKVWLPSKKELVMLSAQMTRLGLENLPFKPLSVSEEVASDIFKYNPYKGERIKKLAAENTKDHTVPLCKVGDFVDICDGHVMAHTKFLGRCTIGAAFNPEPLHKKIFRIQGVALPGSILMNHYAWGILEKSSQIIAPQELAELPEQQAGQST